MAKIWYSFQDGVSEDDHIGFYATEGLDWVGILEDKAPIIKEEVAAFIDENQESLKPYFNKELVSTAKKWKTFSFKVWGWENRKNRKKCPKTAHILAQIPHLTSASVSMLLPQTDIKPHRGDTNAIMRSHLGLKVPGKLPECGFRVKYEDRSWEEGKVLVFNDAAYHRAWNHTEAIRYVLILDVIRPEFQNKKYRVCSTVLAYLIMQMVVGKFPFLEKLPGFVLGIFGGIIAVFIYLILRFRNLLP